MITRSAPPAAALSVSEPPRCAICICTRDQRGDARGAGDIVQLDVKAVLLEDAAFEASHSGKLSAMRLL